MLGLGWTELFVVGVVALIVIGPKELPDLMRKLGRFAGTVRRMGADFQRELNRTTGLDEVKNLRTAITQPLKDTSDALRREFNTVTPSGKVEPSGAIKPADPGSESVANEIKQKAGLPFTPEAAAAMAAGVPLNAEAKTGSETEPETKAASKLKSKSATKRAPKAKAAPSSTVTSADLPPAGAPAASAPARKAKTARKATAAKSPAKAAPAKAAPTKTAPAKAAKPKAAKPKRKPAAKKKTSDG